MSIPEDGSLEDGTQAGNGTGAGDLIGQGGAPQAGGQPPVDPSAPPADQEWAGVPDNIRTAVEKRLGAMTAKNKELEARLESQGQTAQPQAPVDGEGAFDPQTSYSNWEKTALGGDQKAMELFRGFRDIMDQAVVSYVQSQLSPLNTGFQSAEERSFYATNPAATAKKREIEAEMKATPGISREKAWRIVNYGAPPPTRPNKLPPPGQRPGGAGAPSGANDLPRGKGIGAMVEAVATQRGL